jgi:mannosyl-oligosaccharide alpha-1,2-mannosidase
VVRKTKKPIMGLYPSYFDPVKGYWVGEHYSLGPLGDSFYEYLLKSYLLFGDGLARQMYLESSLAIREHMVHHSPKDNLTYLADLTGSVADNKMTHLACFSPGMFALEATYLHHNYADGEGESVMALAEELAHTCHESYVRSASSQLGPDTFYFHLGNNREATTRQGNAMYLLRPEAIESWFYLWRLTGKKVRLWLENSIPTTPIACVQKYKDWVWSAVEAIDRHCRMPNGFVGLKNVYRAEDGYDDVQQVE